MLAMLKTALHYLMFLITGNTMVIVLTGSVNSTIHFVMVDVLGRCESCISVLYSSSLYVNRSNVIECVNITCSPV